MSERDREAWEPQTHALTGAFAEALLLHSRAEVTGSLQVVGDPGGVVRLRGGRVAAVESPGAPGVEALLLRSGRVLEASWLAAHQAGAAGGRVAEELVRRGLVGAAELEASCLMAMFDAAFAICAGSIEICHWEAATAAADTAPHQECWTAAVGSVETTQLLVEAERRLRALMRLPAPVLPGRDRICAQGEPGALARRAPGLGRDVLGLADGRRTARDIAFLLGRGVYPVTMEVARMLADGVVRVEAPGAPGAEVRALLAPRRAAPVERSATAGALDPTGAADRAGPVRLPKRPPRAEAVLPLIPRAAGELSAPQASGS